MKIYDNESPGGRDVGPQRGLIKGKSGAMIKAQKIVARQKADQWRFTKINLERKFLQT